MGDPDRRRLEDLSRAELLDRLREEQRLSSPDLAHSLRVHQVELEMQNRELREAQQLVEESRARYADLYDFAPVGYCTLDASGVVLEINLTGASLLGAERSRLLGRPLSALVGAEGRVVVEHLRRCVAGERRVESELCLGAGSARRVMQVVSEVRPAPDGGVAFRTVLADVTALKRAQETLKWLGDASGRLSATLDEATVAKTLEEVLVPTLAERASVELGEGPGLGAGAAIDASGTLGLRDAIARAADKGYSQLVFEARAGERGESELRSAMAVPLMLRGRVLGVLSLASAPGRRYDDADLALAEQLAERAATALENARLYRDARVALDVARQERALAEQAGRARDEFLATISHELRSPLMSILGWVGLLRGGRLDPERAPRALETVERNARALTRLIDDLLDVGRIIAGKLRLERAHIDLAAQVEAAVDTVRPVAERKQVRVLYERPDAPAVVDGDAARLQQVASNLLNNAVKFSEPGHAVRVSLRRAGRSAELTVSDTGAGIAREVLPYVFERFRQAEGGEVRSKGGLGLGLAIVRSLVEAHGGVVRAESDGPGTGARFQVILPLAAAHRRSTPPAAAEGESEGLPLAGLRALGGDDEDDAREVLCTMLLHAGAEVSVASSAAEGLAVLRVARPGVLLSDIGMPGEDGYELLRRVRALGPDQGGRTPAIALTAYTMPRDRARVTEAGFDAHLSKPVDAESLVRGVTER